MLRHLAIFIFLAMVGLTPARSSSPAVGYAVLHIVDVSRQDPVAAGRQREWMVTLYYPAQTGARMIWPRYAPDPKLLDAMISNGYYEAAPSVLRGWRIVQGPAATRPEAARGVFPIVTLSPGLGFAAFNYGGLAAEIARRGFVVAVVDHPYIGVSQLPDGRILRASDDPALAEEDMTKWAPRIADWARDLSVTIDRLGKPGRIARLAPNLRVDPGRVIAAGHSLGGTIALQACTVDTRISACADFEGTPEGSGITGSGPSKPTLFVGSRSGKPDRPHVAPPLDRPPYSFFAMGKSPANWMVAVRGGSHTSYSDFPFVLPDTLSRFGGELMSPERSLDLYAGMTEAFARAYLPGGRGDRAFAAFLNGANEVRYSRWSAPARAP